MDVIHTFSVGEGEWVVHNCSPDGKVLGKTADNIYDSVVRRGSTQRSEFTIAALRLEDGRIGITYPGVIDTSDIQNRRFINDLRQYVARNQASDGSQLVLLQDLPGFLPSKNPAMATHAERDAFNYFRTQYGKDPASIGISNLDGPCGPESRNCSAFFRTGPGSNTEIVYPDRSTAFGFFREFIRFK